MKREGPGTTLRSTASLISNSLSTLQQKQIDPSSESRQYEHSFQAKT